MITKKTYNIVRLKPIRGAQFDKHRLPKNWNISYITSVVDLHEYRYFWFETIKMIKKQDDGCLTIRTEVINSSGKFFINGYVEEYSDVLVNDKFLAQQMTNLDWTHIVRNIGEENVWTECFDLEKDKLIDFNGDAV